MLSESGLHQGFRSSVRVARSQRAQRVQQADLFAARYFTVLLLIFAVLSSLFISVHAAQQPASNVERALFEAANHERATLGLQPLRWDDSLAAAARDHAVRMAQRNTLSHQLPGELPLQDRARIAGARYTTIAENVAEGPTAETIHSGWMHSAPHRANLLDPELNAVGIAVAVTAGTGAASPGMIFAVQDFSQAVANLNFQEQERQVSAALAARGLQIIDSRSSNAHDARKTCGMDRGWSGTRPNLVVRYEASDLSRLPDDLQQKLQSGKYSAAAIGACDAGTSHGFSHFRVAILFF
jgi:uncharacterized protein YkwD